MIVIILAAGKGTRMKSNKAKVLHSFHGKPLLKHAIDLAYQIKPSKVFVVVGHQKDEVKKMLHSENVEIIYQKQQLGTGHAVMQVRPFLGDKEEEILVLPGDVPSLKQNTITKLMHSHRLHNSVITILTAEKNNPAGYGRVLRSSNNTIERIVEENDCSESEKSIKEINAGIYCFNKKYLLDSLEKIDKNNAQHEYYLTDIIKVGVNTSLRVMAVKVNDPNEIHGINTKEDLIEAEKYFSSLN